ncbi:MAG: hypothetical protein QW270_06960 [Candidatus Bathyarchaeia archaeon]
MIEVLYAIIIGIIASFVGISIYITRRYLKTKDKTDLYFGTTCSLWALAAIFGATAQLTFSLSNNLFLLKSFYRTMITLVSLGYLFLNFFALASTKDGDKKGSIIVYSATIFVVMCFVWVFDLAVTFDAITIFELPSIYKQPIGPPVTEAVVVLFGVLAFYPTYLFLKAFENAKERNIKMKSFLMGFAIAFGTLGFAMEVANAVHYLLYRFMIFLACFVGFLSQIAFPTVPTIPSTAYAFSKTLKLDHKQMIGRKLLFEFDPASNYEKAITNFVAEAVANTEQIFVFTRKGSAIHSVLREHKNVKFFYLTQQLSIPKEISENELLLPSTDTSLMLGILDKTLRIYPYSVINVAFDNLSDLILSVGFDKTYSFLKYALEVLASPKTTVLFLLNKTAHDLQTTSNIRSLFSDQISYGKDGVQIIKLSPIEITMVETGVMPLERRE